MSILQLLLGAVLFVLANLWLRDSPRSPLHIPKILDQRALRLGFTAYYRLRKVGTYVPKAGVSPEDRLLYASDPEYARSLGIFMPDVLPPAEWLHFEMARRRGNVVVEWMDGRKEEMAGSSYGFSDYFGNVHEQLWKAQVMQQRDSADKAAALRQVDTPALGAYLLRGKIQ